MLNSTAILTLILGIGIVTLVAILTILFLRDKARVKRIKEQLLGKLKRD